MNEQKRPVAHEAAATQLSLSEESIKLLVDTFYDRIRLDEKLAPVFNRSIGTDWIPHLTKMYDFWSSVMLSTGRYTGNPVATHKRIDALEIEFFDRWLTLFDQTCRELFDADTADAFQAKANRIADSLELALFYRPDFKWERPSR